jgi:hypothetical protein
LEIASRPKGRRNSSKHLYWDEVRNTFQSGSSVLVYQHFIRVKRVDYIARIAQQLRTSTGAAAVFSFRTPHVLFLLACQERHVGAFRRRQAIIESDWNNQISVSEHWPQTPAAAICPNTEA